MAIALRRWRSNRSTERDVHNYHDGCIDINAFGALHVENHTVSGNHRTVLPTPATYGAADNGDVHIPDIGGYPFDFGCDGAIGSAGSLYVEDDTDA